MGRVEQKVAIVTGAASGMGRSTAILLAEEGASVVVSDLNFEGAQSVVQEIANKGGKASAFKTNVTSTQDINSLVEHATTTYGTIDIIVNNAGVMDGFSSVESISDEKWDFVMDVNCTGPMRLIRKTLPIFLSKGSGVIVNIASLGGLFGSRAGCAYTASKHALVGLTKNVGYQYGSKNIRCNAIAPGGVQTNISSSIGNVDQFGMERCMIGMGVNPRIGSSEEIAKVVLFLCSEEASFINGAVINADAGWSAY
ncbi:hypothetical protein AKO1_008005 [Acrasis kona]|uniref:3-ketoacyl-ACP reductase n=1 Tax=Acrasis kona TaxID=1008807 RepID=A0AAW2YPY7_9EUKA